MTVPFQVPPSGGEFVGRQKEIKELVDCLSRGQSAYVVGHGGLGRSALAGVALRRLVGDAGERLGSSAFPGGVIWLDGWACDATFARACNFTADSLGLGERHLSAESRARKALEGKRVLVVVRDEMYENARLVAVLSTAALTLRLSSYPDEASRAPRIEVGGLTPEEAREFLARRVPGKQSAALGPVLELANGHPMALTLIAIMLDMGEDAGRLASDWRKAVVSPLFGEKTEAHTGGYAMEWLHRRAAGNLAEREQRVLAFAGQLAAIPFTKEVISAAEGTDVGASLAALARAGFLQSDNDGRWRFACSELRRYSWREQSMPLDACNRTSTRIRAEIESATSAAEIGNLLLHFAAVMQLKDQSDGDELDFIGKLAVHQAAEAQASVADEVLEAQSEMVRVVEAKYNRAQRLRGEALTELGFALLRRGDRTAAIERLDVAIVTLRPLMQSKSNLLAARHFSRALSERASLLYDEKKFRESAEVYEEAIQATRSTHNRRDLFGAMLWCAESKRSAGDFVGAAELCAKGCDEVAEILAAEPANWMSYTYILQFQALIGEAQYGRGDRKLADSAFAAARSAFASLVEAMPLDADIYDVAFASSAVHQFGVTLKDSDQIESAIEYLEKALDMRTAIAANNADNLNHQFGVALTSTRIAQAYEAKGDSWEAVKHTKAAVEIYDRLTAADSARAAWAKGAREARAELDRLESKRGGNKQ